jgi:hypothetical protein
MHRSRINRINNKRDHARHGSLDALADFLIAKADAFVFGVKS